jgi:hypothetical protein
MVSAVVLTAPPLVDVWHRTVLLCRQLSQMAHTAAVVTTALGLTKPSAVEPLQVCSETAY